jgi:hypothetical protein
MSSWNGKLGFSGTNSQHTSPIMAESNVVRESPLVISISKSSKEEIDHENAFVHFHCRRSHRERSFTGYGKWIWTGTVLPS